MNFKMYITEAILQYLSLPKTDYAIQINGAWGAGKTYYVKNELKRAIENYDNGDDSEDRLKLCYISLNGFSSVEQIEEAVFLAMTDAKNKLAVQGLKLLSRYGSGLAGFFGNFDQIINNASKDISNKIISNDIENFSNIVLCFDDLERIDDSLSIKQVFGYINTNYIEHNNIKVIFVSNDEDIFDEQNYKQIREKIIGKTLNFSQSESNIIENIVNNTFKGNKNFVNYFETEKENIINAVSIIFEELNLRTLRFAIDLFVILQKEIYTVCKDERDCHELSNTLFLNVLIVSNEYKSGAIEKVEQLSFVHGSYHFFYFSANRDSENEYPQKFLRKYHRVNKFIDRNIHYFPSVSNFVINGYINKQEFQKEINSFVTRKENEKSKNTSLKDPLEILNDFRIFNDKEVKDAQEVILNRIEVGGFSAEEYPRIYNMFLMFKNINLILTEKNDIYNLFTTGFSIALNQWTPNQSLDFWDIDMKNIDKKCEHMIEQLKGKEKQINYRKRKEKVKIWLDALVEDSVEPAAYKDIEHEKDFFEIFVDLGIVENYIKKSNPFIVRMIQFLHHKYLRIINSHEFHSHEIPYIDELIRKIDQYFVNCNEEKVKAYNIIRFREQLEKVKDHIKNSNECNNN